jgi:hypothetical protein
MSEREVLWMMCEGCGKEIPEAAITASYDFGNPELVMVDARCTQCHTSHVAYLPSEDFYRDRT